MSHIVHFENSAAAKAAKNAYMRQWRARNKDKVKAAQWRYWERRMLKEKIAQERGERVSDEPRG